MQVAHRTSAVRNRQSTIGAKHLSATCYTRPRSLNRRALTFFTLLHGECTSGLSRGNRVCSAASGDSSELNSSQQRPATGQGQGPSAPPLWLALLGRLVGDLGSFLQSCLEIRSNLYILSPKEATKRMVLILTASLMMIVVLTCIDSALMYLYLLNTKKFSI